MLQKLNNISLRIYIGVRNKIEDWKHDERGISGVVVAVVLCLVAVLAAGLLWKTINGWLGTFWTDVIKEKADAIGG